MSSFKMLNFEALIKELDKYEFKQLHIHHTWKPTHKSFKGNNHIAMQESMYNHHTKVNGWSDIGQHLTLFPDGLWVTGRPFNVTPASIKEWNTGALAVEMVGNFDIAGTGSFNDLGYDLLQGKQKEEILKLIKYFLEKYGDDSIKFHREGPGAGKTCPGTRLDKRVMVKEAIALGVDKVEKSINDKNKPDDWAKKDWEWAKENGYLDGTRPKDNITRQEMAIIIRRLVEKK